MLEAMLVHGMIIQGNPHSKHYGAAAAKSPNNKELKFCRELRKNCITGFEIKCARVH